MKEEIKRKVNDLVYRGFIPAPFFNAEIYEVKAGNINTSKIYSKKYKQVILSNPTFSPISKIK